MTDYQEKLTRRTKRQKNRKEILPHEETEEVSETCMANLLKLSNWELKTIMINMLRAPKDKVDSI